MRVSTNMMVKTGVSNIQDQQAKLLKTQQQLATGRKILTPADDPAGAARVLNLEKAIGQVDQFNRNLDRAEFSLKTEENALEEFGNTIQRIRELTVQALNDTNGGNDRAQIAKEISQRFNQLVDLANSQDGNSEYLFGGSDSRNQPFEQTGLEVNYTGNQTERLIQTGPGRQLASNHTGFEAFMRIRESNDAFVASADPGNNGTAVVQPPVKIVDDTQAFDGPYAVEFFDNGGQLSYTTTSDSGVTNTEPFTAGDPIRVAGREVPLSGMPVIGDTFEVREPAFKSVFKSVGDLVRAMGAAEFSNTATDSARFQNAGGKALGELDKILDNIIGVRSEVGARLNVIDGERQANENNLLELEKTKSKVEDVDFAEAISRLNLQQVGLEAAQQSYVRIQGLSLFNFL